MCCNGEICCLLSNIPDRKCKLKDWGHKRRMSNFRLILAFITEVYSIRFSGNNWPEFLE